MKLYIQLPPTLPTYVYYFIHLNQLISVTCDESDSIDALKNVIKASTNLSPDKIMLKYKGTELFDDKSIEHYGIESDETISLFTIKEYHEDDSTTIEKIIKMVYSDSDDEHDTKDPLKPKHHSSDSDSDDEDN